MRRARRPLRFLAVAGAMVALSMLPLAAQAQGQGAYDGTWQVILHCDAAQRGAEGYTQRFLASVSGGYLRGQYGARGVAPSLTLEGPIQPDGTAMLSADGLTGSPEYAVGRVNTGTLYHYHMQARFDRARGTGSRVELRPCDAVFTRQ